MVLVARDAARGQATLDWIAGQQPAASLELALADLSSVAETTALAARLAAAHPVVHRLANNAGLFRARRTLTPEGHDTVLAVNHLAPFILMRGLEAPLRAAAATPPGARIVTTGSSTTDRARLDPTDLELTRGWTMTRAYARSKLAAMLATFEQAERLRPFGVTATVVHPGTVATGLIRSGGLIGLAWRLMAPFSRTEAQGAETPLHALLDPALATITATYFKDRAPARPNPAALDRALRRRVWEATERLL